jgi:hypothetical protein
VFVSFVPSAAIHFRDLLLELTRPFNKCQAKVRCCLCIGIDNEIIRGRTIFLILLFLAIHAAAQAKEELLEQVKEASRNSDVSQIDSSFLCSLTKHENFVCNPTIPANVLNFVPNYFEIKLNSAST